MNSFFQHLCRHLTGYATVGGAMTATLVDKLDSPMAMTHRNVVVMILYTILAGFTTITAYRASYVPKVSTPPAPGPAI